MLKEEKQNPFSVLVHGVVRQLCPIAGTFVLGLEGETGLSDLKRRLCLALHEESLVRTGGGQLGEYREMYRSLFFFFSSPFK